MLNFTRALLKLRRDHPALANAADFRPIYAEKNMYPFVYFRTADSEEIIVSVNPAGQFCSVTLNGLDDAMPLLVQGAELRSGRLQMNPVSFGIFAVHAPGVQILPDKRRLCPIQQNIAPPGFRGAEGPGALQGLIKALMAVIDLEGCDPSQPRASLPCYLRAGEERLSPRRRGNDWPLLR